MTIATLPPGTRPALERHADGRVIAGVADGVARHLGVPPLWVRLAFAVTTLTGGAGVLAYAGLWAFVPWQEGPTVSRRWSADRRQAVAVVLLALGLVLLIGRADILGGSNLLVPLLLTGAGVAVVWRQLDGGAPSGPRGRLVLAAGAGLALLGIVSYLVIAGQLTAVRTAALSIVVIVAGIALVTAPWWWRLAGALTLERRERIRTQERAEVAAHLHDSVLQTLALIQRHVDSPREVAKLARGQERELRTWLYGRGQQTGQRFATAVEAVAAEVEDAYSVSVETVVVGDCELGPRARALVAAAREATVNAARHAGVRDVSLYAEVEPGHLAAFVRDRGVGFDEATVPTDRQGLRGSIHDRIRRHGGTATVRSRPGAGTEVELTVPRDTS